MDKICFVWKFSLQKKEEEKEKEGGGDEEKEEEERKNLHVTDYTTYYNLIPTNIARPPTSSFHVSTILDSVSSLYTISEILSSYNSFHLIFPFQLRNMLSTENFTLWSWNFYLLLPDIVFYVMSIS